MERTQISLEPAQADLLRRLAAERHVSMAHLIRDAVEAVYGSAVAPPSRAERWSRALSAVGSGTGDGAAVSADHDRYLDGVSSRVTFADTSALYALLDRADPNHARAARTLEELRATDTRLVTHAYVIVEVVALVQRRLGLEVVRRLMDDLLPVIEVVDVDARLHAEAVAALLAADRRGISLVDRVSFLVMRRQGIRVAFTFDEDFTDEGFAVLPGR